MMQTSRPTRAASSTPADRDVDGVGRSREDRHARLAPEDPQLLDRRRALEVRGDEQRGASLGLEPGRELGRGGGLARALEPREEHDRRRSRRVGHLERLPAERGDELVVDGLHDLLAGGQALRQRLDLAARPDPSRKALTTDSSTSASRSAERISASASSRSRCEIRPRLRSDVEILSSRWARASNIPGRGYPRAPVVSVAEQRVDEGRGVEGDQVLHAARRRPRGARGSRARAARRARRRPARSRRAW